MYSFVDCSIPSRYHHPVLSFLYHHSMEVFRANLQLLEDPAHPPQLASGQPNQPLLAVGQPPNPPLLQPPASAASMGFSTNLTMSSMSAPRILLADTSSYPAMPSEMGSAQIAPQPSNLASPNQMYAIAAPQSNITNNNTLSYPGNIPAQSLLKPFPGASPNQITPNQIPGAELTQPSYVYPQICATAAMHQTKPMTAAHPPPTPIMIPNKLKATPTLISLQSAREHKFMPY